LIETNNQKLTRTVEAMKLLIAIYIVLVVIETVNGNASKYIRKDLIYCIRATRNSHGLSDFKRDQLLKLFDYGLKVDWSVVIPELETGLDDSSFKESLQWVLSPLEGNLPIHYHIRYRIVSAFINELAEAIISGDYKDLDELVLFLLKLYGHFHSRRLSTASRVFLKKTEHYLLEIITEIHDQEASTYSSEDSDENESDSAARTLGEQNEASSDIELPSYDTPISSDSSGDV
jgi:hypothetical protein